MVFGKTLTELGRNNRTSMIAHTTSILLCMIVNVLQVATSGRNPAFLVGDILLGFVPVALERYFWIKNHDTEMIKHLVGIGFALFYTYEMFTTTSYITYTLAIPIMFVITVYHDIPFVLKINAGGFTIQIIMSVLGLSKGLYGYTNSREAIVQIVTMGMVAVFSYWSAKTTFENNQEQLDAAMDAKKISDNMVVDMKAMTDAMTNGITKSSDELIKIKDAVSTTKEAMEQLAAGAANTAEAVINQTSQTENIQNKVELVTDVSDNIMTRMSETMKAISSGRDVIRTLADQVEKSVTDGAEVTKKLENLDKYVEEMHSIVKIINGIANQTSMLALNASIEAARAGEAGRGFAVVASQVTNMAGQTKDATVQISDLIEAVSNAIEEVIVVIRQMLEGINLEKDSSEATVNSFRQIRSNTHEVNDNMSALVKGIEELKQANAMIVESTTTISAISEEVLAQAQETANAQEENAVVITNISDEMENLLTFINKK